MRRLAEIASILVSMTLQSLLGLKVIGSIPPEDLLYPSMSSNKGGKEMPLTSRFNCLQVCLLSSCLFDIIPVLSLPSRPVLSLSNFRFRFLLCQVGAHRSAAVSDSRAHGVYFLNRLL